MSGGDKASEADRAPYELQVANSAKFTPPLGIDKKVTGNQFNTSTLPVGSLFWRVRAMDSLGRPGAWSVTFQLTVASAGRQRAQPTVRGRT